MNPCGVIYILHLEVRWQSCYKAVDKCSHCNPFLLYIWILELWNPFLDKAWHVECAALELCGCRLGFFSAVPEITCCVIGYRDRICSSLCARGMLQRRKFFSADSMDKQKVNFLWCFCTVVWTSTWGGVVLCVRKLLFNAQYSLALLTQRAGGKLLNLAFTRDILDEVSQFTINFFFFPGWDRMRQKKKKVRS